MQHLDKPPSRIVVVSSALHALAPVVLDDLHWERRRYNPLNAYAQSKWANILYAKELAARSRGKYVAVSVHPGLIMSTAIWRTSGMIGPLMNTLGRLPGATLLLSGDAGLKSIRQGAATTVWALLSDQLSGGEYCTDCRPAWLKNPQ